MLIASGDVLLTFDSRDVNFDHPGVTGVAYPGPVERGARHGVYVAARDRSVVDFVRKSNELTARAHNAVDAAGRGLVYTGLLSLNPDTVERRLSFPGVLEDLETGRFQAIDLYDHILTAFGPSNRSESSGLPAGMVDPLRRIPFRVNILPWCDFFHVGSTWELLSNIGLLNRTIRVHGFSNFDRSHVAERASLEGAFVYNSILTSKDISTGEGVFLEAVHTSRPIDLPNPNVVVNWPKEAKEPLKLPPGKCLVCLPVGAGEWSTLVFKLTTISPPPSSLWSLRRQCAHRCSRSPARACPQDPGTPRAAPEVPADCGCLDGRCGRIRVIP